MVHLPGLGRALGHRLEHRLGIDLGAVGEVDRLGQTLQGPGDADLIDHLGELAGARPPDPLDRLGVGRDHRPDAVNGRLLPSDHDGELAGLGARLAARHRGVHEPAAELPRPAGRLTRELGRSGGVVDDHAALGHGRQRLVHHLAHVVVIADAEQHHLAARDGLGDGRAGASAMRSGPAPGLFRRTVEHRDLMARGLQVPGHGKAHHPETDECELHVLASETTS